MQHRRHEDRIVTLLCFGISGAALTLGMWIAASPFGTPPLSGAPASLRLQFSTPEIVLAEAR
jgi:hypothetical protein